MKVVGYKDYKAVDDADKLFKQRVYFMKSWLGTKTYKCSSDWGADDLNQEVLDWILMGRLPKDVVLTNKEGKLHTSSYGPR